MLIMKAQKYVIWLQGFLEACGKNPTPEQVLIIKTKLNDLFEHAPIPEKKVDKIKPHNNTFYIDSDDYGGGVMRC